MSTEKPAIEPVEAAPQPQPPESKSETTPESSPDEKADTTLQPPQPPMPILRVSEENADGERSRPRPLSVAENNNATQDPSPAPSPRPLSALYPHTQVTYEDADFTRPPPLNYTLRTRKMAIIIFWLLIIIDSVFFPIGLYFGLWYGTNLSPNAVFSISTATLGGASIFEYFIRFYRLWKKDSNCRVIGAQRHYLDWFHWNLTVAWVVVMIELIVGTCPHNPPIRLLAIPPASMIFAIGIQLVTLDIMRIKGYKAPCRISSLPAGAPLRPGIYAYIEDVCAVDGSGGTEFRQRFNLRYQASKPFREMLHRLTLFWAAGCFGITALTAGLVFTIQRDAAYVVGWTVPFIWAGVWTAMTIPYVQHCLKVEYAQWTTAKWKS